MAVNPKAVLSAAITPAVTLAVVAALSGCTSTATSTSDIADTSTGTITSEDAGAATDAAASSLDLPEKNVSKWTLPLDPYVVTQAQTLREAYFHALLSQKCLTQKGFAHRVPALDLSDETRAPGLANQLTVSAAKKFGYHLVQNHASGSDAWESFTYRQMSDAEAQALDTCVREVVNDPDIPQYDAELLNAATRLSNGAQMTALEDSDVRTAAARWRTCMRPLGIDDLPEDPTSMPTDSMRTRYGWALSSRDTALPTGATEFSDALADAKCRVDSGYEKALYSAEWDAQVPLLEQNYEKLEDIRTKISDIDAEITKRITLTSSAQ